MSNALTAFNPEYWAAEMQVIFFKESVALVLANTELRALLSDGDTVNKPYRSKPRAKTYTKGSDITIDDRFSTNEALSVDTAKVVPFYVDDIDKIQNKWDMATKFAQDGQRELNKVLDQLITKEVTNASSTVDAGSVGGSAGSNIAMTVSNVDQIFTASSRKLDELDIPAGNRFALIGPRILETVRRYIGGKETVFGDIVGANGKVMNRFGFELFYSNNLYFTASLAMATAPTVLDTVTINGAVLEFATDADVVSDDAYIGVLRGGTVDIDRAALVSAINDSGTQGTTYSDPDAENDLARWKLTKAGVVATNDNANDLMTIVAYGDIILSESSVPSDTIWSAETSNAMFGLKGATDLVVQKSPNVEFRMAEKRLGRYVYPWVLYGAKTFTDMTDALVRVKIDASSWA